MSEPVEITWCEHGIYVRYAVDREWQITEKQERPFEAKTEQVVEVRG